MTVVYLVYNTLAQTDFNAAFIDDGSRVQAVAVAVAVAVAAVGLLLLLLSLLLLFCILTLTRIIKSVVTGQAPVTLELRNTPEKTRTNQRPLI